MPRSDIHIKVVVEHERGENLEKLAGELCRALQKLYPVRSATVTSTVSQSGDD